MNDGRRVLIIGGGVIGIASAYYLNQAGFQVTVLDKGRVGAECSHGNCGLICPSHVLPLAEPGAIRGAMKALLDPAGAFRIQPRLDLSLWRWLMKFAKRCNEKDMLTAAGAIQPLLTSSLQLYQELVSSEGLQCEWQKQGLLFVYQKQRAFEAYAPVNELLREKFNEPARRLDGAAVGEFEPALKDGLAGGWYFEHDAHLRPDRLIQSWRSLLESRGVRFVENCELQSLQETHDSTSVRGSRVTGVVAGGQTFEADSFVVATGAKTPLLASLLRFEVPIQPGKGYSITVARPPMCPTVPMIFPEHRVAVTPMDSGLRLGSIMEFAGYDAEIRPERLRLLTRGVGQYLREPLQAEWPEPWYGWRPMTYDSVPVIGRCPGFSNVLLATGHSMLGLSMAPATGRLVSEMISQATPHIDSRAYRADRF